MKCKNTVEILEANDSEPEFWSGLGMAGGRRREIAAENTLNDEDIKLEEENTTWFYR